jgi:small GTP-binding protein
MFKKQDENNIKMILVGSSGAGKTNIINFLIGEKFQSIALSTTSSSYIEKQITIDNKLYEVEIWDTAGQEKFHSLTKIFIKGAKIVLFVYELTSRKSFEEIDFWVKTVKDLIGEQPVFGLAGNKKDLYLQEEVNDEEGVQKGEEIGAIFKVTSAKTGFGISELFEQLMREYIKKSGKGDFSDDKALNLQKRNLKKKRKCCN